MATPFVLISLGAFVKWILQLPQHTKLQQQQELEKPPSGSWVLWIVDWGICRAVANAPWAGRHWFGYCNSYLSISRLWQFFHAAQLSCFMFAFFLGFCRASSGSFFGDWGPHVSCPENFFDLASQQEPCPPISLRLPLGITVAFGRLFSKGLRNDWTLMTGKVATLEKVKIYQINGK